MTKKIGLTKHDWQLWQAAVKHVKPLSANQTILPLSSTNARRKRFQRPKPAIFLEETAFQTSVASNDALAYQSAQLSKKAFKDLTQGKYPIAAKLDLHHFDVPAAHRATAQFLADALTQNHRMVLIIHGKGHLQSLPVLKNKLNGWLKTAAEVDGFCSALPKHGGTGAIYVLLKVTEPTGRT